MSDGAWHWSRGYKIVGLRPEDLWVMKPAQWTNIGWKVSHHYTQTTLLDQTVQEVIESSEETQETISPPLYLSQSFRHEVEIARTRTGSRQIPVDIATDILQRAHLTQDAESTLEEMHHAFSPAGDAAELRKVRAGLKGPCWISIRAKNRLSGCAEAVRP